MAIDTSLDLVRTDVGAPALPRWLSEAKGAVLLAGHGAGPVLHRRRLDVDQAFRHGTPRAGLAAVAALAKGAPMASGLLGLPEWDVTRRGDDVCRCVEIFGGATSKLALQWNGADPVEVEPNERARSLGAPRYARGYGDADPVVLTACDAETGTAWRLVQGKSGPEGSPVALGPGLRAQIVRTGAGDILLSATPRKGGASPLGDRAGQLHVAALDDDGRANGLRPLGGTEDLLVYQFDAAPMPDGGVCVAVATARGLALYAGSGASVALIRTIAPQAVLHPALAVTADRMLVAYNLVNGAAPGATMVASLQLPSAK